MKFFSKKMLQKWSFANGLTKNNEKSLSDVISTLHSGVGQKSSNTDSLVASSGFASSVNRRSDYGSKRLEEKAKRKEISSNQVIDSANFIQIGLASSDEIQNWAERSYFIGDQFVEIGEVKRPDTLNYRTFKPEKDGLFCERIFGPVNDWTCACGQIKEQRFALDHERALLGKLKPKVCANCQVEVTSSRLRRYRMGYISLACPVTHIWYLNSRPSLFSILLKMPTKYIKKIAYYKAYSPSSLQREYMSSCLGPGGDFFDNEWEFLHLWLSGKHSIEDIPSRRTQSAGSTATPVKEEFSRLSSRVGSELGRDWNNSNLSVNRSLKSFQPSNIQNVSSTRTVSSVIAEAIDGSSDSGEKVGRLIAPAIDGSKSNKIAKQFPGVVEQLEIDELMEPGFDDSSLPGFSKAESSQGVDEVHPLRGFYKKMPESPEWLANTGAQALLNHLKSRDWQKECEKLEFELQSTPSLNEENSETDFSLTHVSSEHKLQQSRFSFPSGFMLSGASSVIASAIDGSKSTSESSEATTSEEKTGSDLTDQSLSRLDGGFTEKETDFLLKRRKARVRTLKLLKSFQKSGLPFTGMIFHSLPVLPPELRPIIQLGAGQLASSDVNDLYRRILSRNNRLKYYLYETHFVEFLVRSEQQLVQLAVDALLENGKTTSVRHTSGQKRLYKSLSDRIGGKQGRFRMNLLGKRVDYSGRSVIVVGPRLKLYQCGLPYEMAVELFQPFLLRHMLELQLAKTIRAAKNILRFNKPLARQLLHHVVQAHPILLNRAPTLHRLGIQAFQPVLVFGRAIHLHPLVCPAFNADFDGDQMAVHIPLSPQARIEARLLMLASGNWLSSSTGQPNVLPSQDMVLGFYYLTIEKYAYQKGRGLFFNTLADVMQAYEIGSIDLHSQIWLKWYGPFTGDSTNRLTTPQKHDKLKSSSGLSRKGSIATKSQGWLKYSDVPSDSIEKSFKNSIYRFKRDNDQPIEIRLNKNGISTKIYSSYQWQQDSEEQHRVSYIRTTPGRVLMNQIFHTFS
jgi:DNA-directed RNA polymerase beta' subunit